MSVQSMPALRWLLGFAVAAVVLLGGYPATSRSEAQSSGAGSICVRREPLLPVDEDAKPMPRGLYFFHIDDLPPVEVRPDKGTLVSGLDVTKSHLVLLSRGKQAIASMPVRVSKERPQCVGLANYEGGITVCASKCEK
ncbi:hypothetical protein A7982_12365 [Minicystis rosea]|nr:hypothetical protein A7982_12365 [Minicystis rosea]